MRFKADAVFSQPAWDVTHSHTRIQPFHCGSAFDITWDLGRFTRHDGLKVLSPGYKFFPSNLLLAGGLFTICGKEGSAALKETKRILGCFAVQHVIPQCLYVGKSIEMMTVLANFIRLGENDAISLGLHLAEHSAWLPVGDDQLDFHSSEFFRTANEQIPHRSLQHGRIKGRLGRFRGRKHPPSSVKLTTGRKQWKRLGSRLPRKGGSAWREEVPVEREMLPMYYRGNGRKSRKGGLAGFVARDGAVQLVEAGKAEWPNDLQNSVLLRRRAADVVPAATSLTMPAWVTEGAADGNTRCIELVDAWNCPPQQPRPKAAQPQPER